MFKTLEELIAVIRQRKESLTEESYTKKLLNNKKLSVEKVKEEIMELINAIEKNTNKVHEAADVLYHLMVLLEANGIKIEDVMEELNKRKKWSKQLLLQELNHGGTELKEEYIMQIKWEKVKYELQW